MLRTKKSGYKLFKEIKRGIAQSIPFLLSHHEKNEQHKCIRFLGVPICSRCSGVYFGFLLGALAQIFGAYPNSLLIPTIILLPFPALLDWFLYRYKKMDSGNIVRVITGILLGFAFITGLINLILNQNRIPIIIVGLIYGLVAVALIIYKSRKEYKKLKK